MANKPIKEALGLGERLQLGGTYVECVPACLADLEDAIEYWSKSIGRGLSIQACYHPQYREEAKPALEELLYIACGRKIPKDELLKKVSVADGGKEVLDFIDRFLGLEPRRSATEAPPSEQG